MNVSNFVKEVVEIVIKRHKYLVKNYDTIVKEISNAKHKTPIKGGAEVDEEKNEDMTLAFPINRAREFFQKRMEQSISVRNKQKRH